jgi:hypothetical protein
VGGAPARSPASSQRHRRLAQVPLSRPPGRLVPCPPRAIRRRISSPIPCSLETPSGVWSCERL